MATTVAYSASLCTRKTGSSSNAKSNAASQEFYENSYNYVGIISFSGMNLANKVIKSIWLSIDAAKAGYGAGSTKTVYMRKANYQNGIASGVTGINYTGDALGTSLDGVNYTEASFTCSKRLSASGDLTLTVTVTDSRGRTATYTETLTVLDYSYPSIRLFKADRCNEDGTAAQVDGTHVRYSFQGSVVSLNNKNALAGVVYYKLASDSEWTKAESLPVTSYTLSATDKVLTQIFDALSSYDIKVRLQDYFYYVEQAVSIGTKGVIMDFLADGTGIAFGKVAETSGYAEFGWPLKLTEPLEIEQGGTGASTAAGALSALGGVKKSGDTMTGNLSIQGYLYPSMYLLPYYNNTTNRTVFEGSYAGASSFASWEDNTGNNRRMLEVRTKAYQSSVCHLHIRIGSFHQIRRGVNVYVDDAVEQCFEIHKHTFSKMLFFKKARRLRGKADGGRRI